MKKTWSRVLATVLVLAMVLCMPGFAASVADTTDFESDRATSADELTDADLPELLSASPGKIFRQRPDRKPDRNHIAAEVFDPFAGGLER